MSQSDNFKDKRPRENAHSCIIKTYQWRSMGSESEEKIRNNNASAWIYILQICGFIILLASPFLYMMLNYHYVVLTATATSTATANYSDGLTLEQLSTTLSKYEKCLTSFPSRGNDYYRDKGTKEERKNAKAIWFTHFPSSLGIDEDTVYYRDLTNTVTGLSSGGKSFYKGMKRKKLRQCFDEGFTLTATCSNIHPVVKMARSPEGNSKFYSKYIIVLRNPIMVLPAYYNFKQIKYHDVKGQVPEDDWRNHRDEYLDIDLQAWISMIKTWKDMKSTLLKPVYLVYEYLMNPITGPDQIQQYADLLKQAGFEVASKTDIPCIWYNTVGRKKGLIDYHMKNKYDYNEYIPAYNTEHKNLLVNELQKLIFQYEDDLELVNILQMYSDEIKNSIRLD